MCLLWKGQKDTWKIKQYEKKDNRESDQILSTSLKKIETI